MKTSEAFAGRYLKAVDLGQSRPVVTIDRVDYITMEGKRKAVLYFVGKEKGLMLNLTNANTIQGMTGTDEMDNWKGQRITLYATKVDFQGKRVDAIRVEDPPFEQRRPTPPPPPREPGSDDDIAF